MITRTLFKFLQKNSQLFFWGILFFVQNSAWAADSAPTVTSISPAIAAKRLSVPIDSQSQTTSAPTTIAKLQTPTAFPGAEQIKFKLNQVVITGNTVYSTADLAKIFAPSLGKEISLLDLQNLVYEITTKYRRDGYVISRAFLPAQRIQSGIVQVQIIEGFINEVTVTGDPGRAKSLIQRFGKRAATSHPLRLADLERYVLLSNDLSGTDVRAVLTPSPTTPNASELSLVSQHQFAQGYMSYNNYGTRYLGPLQISGGGNLNSLFMPGDTTIARVVVTSRTKQLQFLQLAHVNPLGSSGARLAVSGSYTRTNPGFLLDPFDIVGISKTAQSDVSYPIIRSRAQNLSVHGGLDYEDNASTVLGEQLYGDHLRVLTVGSSYDRVDKWRGINTFKFDASRGFNILGATNGPLRSRPQGLSNFTKVDFNASRLQSLSSRFSALVAMQSQYSFCPLLAAEEFTYGGPDFGRGYDPAEIAGDKGIAGKAELRMDTAPGKMLLQSVQYYIFYDVGAVWNLDRNDPQAHVSAASAGLGARVNFTKHFSGDAFLAKPLTRPVATMVLSRNNANAPRGFFQVRANF